MDQDRALHQMALERETRWQQGSLEVTDSVRSQPMGPMHQAWNCNAYLTKIKNIWGLWRRLYSIADGKTFAITLAFEKEDSGMLALASDFMSVIKTNHSLT